MQWINDYWYLIILGLVTVMLLFGYMSKSTDKNTTHDDQNETHDGGKEHKGGHGCCH